MPLLKNKQNTSESRSPRDHSITIDRHQKEQSIGIGPQSASGPSTDVVSLCVKIQYNNIG